MRIKGPLYLAGVLAISLAFLAGCSKKENRTDAQVATDVQTKIYSDNAIQSRQISVQAVNGVVTLSGDVNSDSERAAAASDAATIAGVKTVVNNLQLQQAQGAPATPARKPAKDEKKKNSAGSRSWPIGQLGQQRHPGQYSSASSAVPGRAATSSNSGSDSPSGASAAAEGHHSGGHAACSTAQ